MRYRPDIDGLRALAVMAVVLHHLSPGSVSGGYVGVDVFFVISGYLITKIVHEQLNAGTFSIAAFYERRVRRIFPALFAVLITVLVAGWFLYLPSDYLTTIRAAISTVTFSANILFWRSLKQGYFAEDAALNPLLHMWSLGVEEQFYIVLPITLMIALRYRKGWLLTALVIAAFASAGLSAALIGSKQVAVFFLLPFRAWELLVGCIAAITTLRFSTSARIRECVAWIALFAIIAPAFSYTPETVFPGLAAIPPVLGTVMLIHLHSSHYTNVSRLLSWNPAVFIGLISYSLYLWHWPVIVFAKYWLQDPSLEWWTPLLLSISFVLAWLTYAFIEQPARRKPASGSLYVGLISGAIAVVALVGVGMYAIAARGFESRWPAQSIAIDYAREEPAIFDECEFEPDGMGGDDCVIGDKSVPPDALLWGDSHMRAWLPGFDVALRNLRRSAIFVVRPSCAPLIAIDQQADIDCKEQNDGVLGAVGAHAEIRQVILASLWSRYFTESNFSFTARAGDLSNAEVASDALRKTLVELAAENRDIVVLGPVPTYPYDVPLTLARSFGGRGALPLSSVLASVHQDNAIFYATIGKITLPGVRFVDVAYWMCSPTCEIYDRGSLYRDSNHLSPFGASHYATQLADVISDASPAVRPAQ